MGESNSYTSHSLVQFFYYFAYGAFSSILSLYLSGEGKDMAEISFIISAGHLFGFAILPVVGFVHDISAKPRWVACGVLLATAISGLAFGATKNTWLLFLFNGLTISLVQSLVGITEKLCSSGSHQYGKIRVWGAVGYAVAAQTAGILYQYVEPGYIFLAFAAAILLTLAALCRLPEEETSNWTSPVRVRQRFQFWKNGKLLLFLGITIVFSGATNLNNTYFPLLLAERGQSVSATGTVLFLGTLLEIPLILYSARFMDKLQGRTLLSICFGILVMQFSIYAFDSTALSASMASICLKHLATMLFIMVTLKITMSLLDDDTFLVTALGLAATAKTAGSFVFQNLGGLYVNSASISSLYEALAGLSVLGLFVSFAIMKKTGEKTIFQ